jgi:hypothetical protein
MGKMINTYKILIGKPEGKGTLRRHRRRWEDNIKMDLMEIDESVEWIHLAQDKNWWRALVNLIKGSPS